MAVDIWNSATSPLTNGLWDVGPITAHFLVLTLLMKN